MKLEIPSTRFVPISSHLVSLIKWFEWEKQIQFDLNYIRQAEEKAALSGDENRVPCGKLCD